MKICNKCGAMLPDEAMFCTSCGTSLDEDFDGTIVLEDNDIDKTYENDLDATGLLNEDDFEATGILDEESVQEIYSYETVSDSESIESVNSAYINPNFQQNQTQQYVPGNNEQSHQSHQTAMTTNYNTNTYPQQAFVEQPTLKNCYKKFWQNYTNFSGRARRSEYWFVVLANFLIAFVNIIPYAGQVLYSLYALAIIVPTLALIVRRLHDLGKEWYYIFFLLIPIAGQIIMLVWLCTDSQVGANKFGENPKGMN